MTSSDLSSIVEHIQALILASRRKEALEAIEKLSEDHRRTTEVLRLASIAHSSSSGLREAYEILREVTARKEHTIEDLYWAGQRAAEFADYKDAEIFLSRAIDRSKDTDDSYYLSCSQLLRAFVRLHLGKYELAKEDLGEVDKEAAEITWSSRLGPITKDELLRQLDNMDAAD